MAVRSVAELGLPPLQTGMLIGKEWTRGHGDPIPTHYPATGEVLGEIASASQVDVDEAVARAREAFDKGPWPRMSANERAAIMKRFAGMLLASAREMGPVHTADIGKISREAQGEVFAGAFRLTDFANLAGLVRGETMPYHPDLVLFSLREPTGVVAGLLPFNVPMIFAGGKAGAALAAGNCIILKPSPLAPLSTLKFVEIGNQAGLPPGVLQVVCGGNDVAAWLAGHDGVDMITLTGSVGAGTAMMNLAAPTIKKVLLELGGKSANIVFADADMDLALRGTMQAVFPESGQRCFAGSRLLVQRSIHDEFVARLAELTKQVRVGDPFDPAVEMGSMISRQALERVDQTVKQAVADGAQLVVGGAPMPVHEGGAFYAPTILDNVDNRSQLAQEEIFGPVASVIPFDDEDEAVAIANDSKFGLAGGVWTNDLNRATRVSRNVRTGWMWINTWAVQSTGTALGGVKQSGLGQENGLSGLYEFMETKSVIMDISGGKTVTWFPEE